MCIRDRDKKQKEEVEARNQTDSLCYSTEQTLAELGDKVSGDLKSKAESAIADAKKALEGSDIEAIKSAGEALQSVAYELAQMVYALSLIHIWRRSYIQVRKGASARPRRQALAFPAKWVP